jgi:predicted phosphodiesterase
VASPPAAAASPSIALPNRTGSLKFAVLGDFGTGGRPEYELADQMARLLSRFKLDLVVLVGDNLYGSERPQDFERKFEIPYKPVLDAGVRFYGALGNHDAREQRDYKLFNMDGKLYYSFKAPRQKVRFFMLDSTYPVPEQIDWLEKELKGSNDAWKIAVFHHPIYSSGGRHGSDLKLRETLEPLFLRYDVSVVLSGHDHFYERIKPQHGIAYFVVGSGGQLAAGDIQPGTGLTAKGFDTDRAFMAVEIDGDTMSFNAISRTGTVVDSGTISRKPAS